MKCQFCGKESPDDSLFCQFCGKKKVEPEETVLKADENLTNTEESQNDDNKKKQRNKRNIKDLLKGKNKVLVITSVIVSVALVASIIFNIVLFSKNNANSKVIIDLSSKIETKDAALEQLRKNSESYKEKSDYYDEIKDFLDSAHPGFASDKFNVSKCVFILPRGSSDTMVLRTDFDGFTTVSKSSSKYGVALVDYTEDEWYGDTTTLKIHALQPGSTKVTFSNNLNSQTFTILIIVTD